MTTTATPVTAIAPIGRDEAERLAATENQRVVELLRSLDDEAWTRQTDCPAWDVRAMAGHLLGAMESAASVRENVHQLRAGRKAAGDRPLIDGITEVQVTERSHLTPAELLDRLHALATKSARARARVPSLVRRVPFKQEVGGQVERWRLGYLLDIVLTRDAWMHRVDIARAAGAPLSLTADHDGRLVADVVAEWARRHGQPFTLHLEGPAGGSFTDGEGGEAITIDAVEFCRTLSGRATGTGLLTQEVPF